MNTHISPQQIADYRDRGFHVMEEFLSPAELEEWREAVDEAVGERGDRRILGFEGTKGDAGESYYDRVFIQRVNLWQSSERIKRLILDERIGRMCCELEGIEGIRVWHDQALIKPPGANQTSWHLDNPYWSFASRHAVSIWIALDDATPANGCLYFLPGTHKEADPTKNVGITPDMAALFNCYPQWRKVAPVAAPMRAGQCSFHNGLVAHAAGPNLTAGYRRAMTCAFMPVGSTFNGQRNILTAEQLAVLKVGDELRDDVKNPVIWAR